MENHQETHHDRDLVHGSRRCRRRLCQALGVILGGPNVKDAVGSFAYIIYKVGNLGMSTMIIPVICAAISYSSRISRALRRAWSLVW